MLELLGWTMVGGLLVLNIVLWGKVAKDLKEVYKNFKNNEY